MFERGTEVGDSRVGAKIRERRKKAGISQEQLAEMIGVSVTAMSGMERGINFPTMENFIKIANAIGASADDLLCDVIAGSSPAKASELSERLQSLSLTKRNQIYAVIETMIATEE